jgi:hypothetical protein
MHLTVHSSGPTLIPCWDQFPEHPHEQWTQLLTRRQRQLQNYILPVAVAAVRRILRIKTPVPGRLVLPMQCRSTAALPNGSAACAAYQQPSCGGFVTQPMEHMGPYTCAPVDTILQNS